MESDYKYLFKIIIIGDSGVGKTCFLKRYTDNTFQSDYISTIGVDFKIKTTSVENEVVKLQLWDTAGQERFSAITKSYYRGAHGIIVIFDLSNENSFKSLEGWFRKIRENASPACEVVLLGSKVDLGEDISVEDQRIDKFLAEKKIQRDRFYKVSAKEDIKVSEVFKNLAKILVEKTKRSGFVGLKAKDTFDFSSASQSRRCC